MERMGERRKKGYKEYVREAEKEMGEKVEIKKMEESGRESM